MTRISIDPVAGIEGTLRIEARVEGARVVDAWTTSSRFRGIELILQGQDPRDAWTFVQRICGGCARSHALCSVRAVENALQIDIPENARLVRNILTAIQHIQDHVIHFYHLHALDWVDITSALRGDPQRAARFAQSVSDWPLSDAGYFHAVKERLSTFFQSKWAEMLGQGYGGHPAYKLPPEASLMVMAHYLQALDWLRDVSRIQCLCGNPGPHLQTYRVGGVACSMDPNQPDALDATHLAQGVHLFGSALGFIEKVYIRDLVAVASYYKDWSDYGGGPGNYMVYGDFPVAAGDSRADGGDLYLPGGLILARNLSAVHPLRRDLIAQRIASAWSDSASAAEADSWFCSPRYDGTAMEVGPLARMLVAYGSPHERVRFWLASVLGELELPTDALFSTLGRTISRGIETVVLAERVSGWLDELVRNTTQGDHTFRNPECGTVADWPHDVAGFGWAEAPHGALCHSVQVEGGIIAHYRCLVPSAWNASPRDAGGQRGACEAALLSTPVVDSKRPIEVLRTLHAFDPCPVWAVHMTSPRPHEAVLVSGG